MTTIRNTGVTVKVGPRRTTITTREGERIQIQAADWPEVAAALARIASNAR